jgi:hypothetical protein
MMAQPALLTFFHGLGGGVFFIVGLSVGLQTDCGRIRKQ